MARSRRREPQSPEVAPHHVAAQQDEAEIADELGAQKDPESGELAVDEKAARQAGAVDTESVRENRRLKRIVHGKRTGQRDIHVNVDDILVKYDTILRLYPPDTMYISVKRVSGGSPVQQTITSAPRNGRDLYEALKAVHGRHEEAAYAVNFFDANSKEYRGKGQITMPDTRDASAQGQSMNYPPYGGGGYPPGPQAPPGYPQPFQPQPQSAPPAPQAPDVGALLTGFRQLMDMMQAYQSGALSPAAPALAGSPQGASGDFSAQIDQLRQMLDLLQSPSGARPAPRGGAAPMNPQFAAAMMGMGMPAQPPAGTMWVPGFGYVSVDRLMQALGGGPSGGSGYRGPFRGPYAGGPGGDEPLPRPPYSPIHVPAPEKTAVEQFRDSITLLRTAATAARDFTTMFPGQEDTRAPLEDDSPVRVIDTGAAKIVVNKKDGSLRAWETGWANVDRILKWAGDQMEISRSREAPPRTVLPPGYVEVGPGYRPPPGFVAVPVGEPPPRLPRTAAQTGLPAPPRRYRRPLGGPRRPCRSRSLRSL
jgi:hypothetical protein